MTEKGSLSAKEIQLHRALMHVKEEVDEKLEGQEDILANQAWFDRYLVKLVAQQFVVKEKIELDAGMRQNISNLIGKEYFQLHDSR